MIFLIEDEQLRKIALSYFLMQKNRVDMLLESNDQSYLQFEINKGLTLRTFLGDDKFKE